MNVLIYFCVQAYTHNPCTMHNRGLQFSKLYGIQTEIDRYLQKISFYFLLRKWSIFWANAYKIYN
jgi:hypothetical protein